MRYLTLIRHAKSSWRHTDLTDFERPLNARGHRDAPRMAARVRQALPTPDVWISSPATRAMMTARLFAETLTEPLSRLRYDAAVYDASLDTLVTVLRGLPDDAEQVWLFGHNPGLTLLTQWLAAETAPAHMPTCAVAHLALSIPEWRTVDARCGQLRWFSAPKLDDDPAPPSDPPPLSPGA